MARTGQITVTTAGTPVRGTDQPGIDFYLTGLPTNSGSVWVRAYGSSDGKYPIPAGQQVIVSAGNLQELEFDADTNGDKIAWLAYW